MRNIRLVPGPSASHLVSFDVAGTRVPGSRVLTRPMNFDQPIAGHPPVPYVLLVPVAEFRHRMDETYRQYRRELRDDLDPDDPDEDESSLGLMRAGWPDLDVLLHDHPVLAAQVVRKHLFLEVLYAYTGAPVTEYAYLVNSLDQVRVDAHAVVLSGQGYPTER